KVFGFMWSLNPDLRTNEVYQTLLKKYQPQLLEIPWARTGLIYPLTAGKPDEFTKSHHEYGKLIREEILPSYKDLLFNHNLQIFNPLVVRHLYNLSTRLPIDNNYNYEGVLIWRVSLIRTCEKYNIGRQEED